MTTTGSRPHHQPVEPPYLLTAGTAGRGSRVAVTGDAGMTVVEIAVRGRWSTHLGEQVSAALLMCLAGPPASVVVALHELADPRAASLPFWLALWRQARLGIVPVHVTFSIASATALSRRIRNLRGPQPRVYATVPEARAAIATRRSRTDRLQAWLAPRPASVKAARNLVTRACQVWSRPNLLADSWLIASELAANAVEHARTDFTVTMSCSDTGLYVVIHDCVSRFPGADELMLADGPASLGERGRGLRLVHATAAAWGTMPTPDGKVVWAAVT